jgi:hypothetical protein
MNIITYDHVGFKSNVYNRTHIIRDALDWLYEHFENVQIEVITNALSYRNDKGCYFREFEKYHQIYEKPMDYNEYDKLTLQKTDVFYFSFIHNDMLNFTYLVIAFAKPEDAVLFKMTFDYEELP